MEKLLTSICLLIAFSNLTYSQCNTNYSVHQTDQGIQAPCYIFATIAALESLTEDQIDISEWHMYSECVLEGLTGSSDILINKTMEFASEVGALKHEDFYDPFGSDGQGCINSISNSSTSNTPCIFICKDNNNNNSNFCENNSSGPVGMIYDPVDESNFPTCSITSIDDGTVYNFNSFTPSEYYVFSNLEKTDLDTEELANQVEDQLCDGNGVVLIIDDYRPNGSSDPKTQHSIFVHGSNGNGNLIYKDSWPGNADPARTQSIIWANVVKAFTITGSVTLSTEDEDTPCDCTIIDPGTISGPTVVSTSGDCSDLNLAQSISSDNLNVAATNNGQLIITPTLSNCEETGFISMDDCDSFYAEFTVDPEPQPVIDILVYALQVCPGDIIELNIYDNNNAYPTTTYNWDVTSGGSITSGQGSPVIFVSIPPNTFGESNINNKLTVTVTAINACGVSQVFNVQIPFSENCDEFDDGQFFIEHKNSSENELSFGPNPAEEILFILNPKGTEIQSQIFNMKGELIIKSSDNSINVESLTAGAYFIQITDKVTGKNKFSKFVKQ